MMSPFTHLPPKLRTTSFISFHSAFKNWIGFTITKSPSTLKLNSLRCSGLNSSSIMRVSRLGRVCVFTVSAGSGLVTVAGWEAFFVLGAYVTLNSGIGYDSATSSKRSLLTIASTCLENKSYLMSKSSTSSGRLEVKDADFPRSASVRNSGVSFIILIFIFHHSELLFHLAPDHLRVLFTRLGIRKVRKILAAVRAIHTNRTSP